MSGCGGCRKATAPRAEEDTRGAAQTGGATLDAEKLSIPDTLDRLRRERLEQLIREDGVPMPEPVESFSPPADAHPTSRKFYALLAEAARLHDKKQRDYGTDEDPFANVRASEKFGIPAWLGCAVRMNDKMIRIQSFAKKGELVNESIEDAFLDLLVYAGIAAILYREAQG